jgi:hypothetical protein
VGPCFETASVTERNGSGLNPLCFHSSNAPRPGETWRTTVDTTVHPGPTFFGAAFYLRPSSGVVVNAGEILVDPDSPRVGLVVLPVHTALETLSFDLPARPELCGRSMTGQAFLLGAGQLLLGNALDLTIGE